MQSEAIRTDDNEPVKSTLEVISHGSNLYVHMAFDDPNAVVQEVVDEHGKYYAMVSNSHPTVSNEEWRCFSLVEPIPFGSRFSGVLVVNGASHPFEGEAVNWQPAFGVSSESQTNASSSRHLAWLLLPLAAGLFLGIAFLVRNASSSGGTNTEGELRPVESPVHSGESTESESSPPVAPAQNPAEPKNNTEKSPKATEEEKPQDTHVVEEPQDAHVVEEPQDAHVDEKPQDAHVDEKPQDARGDEKAQDAHVVEEPQDARGDEKAQDARGDEKAQDARGDEKAQDARGGKKTPEPFEVKPPKITKKPPHEALSNVTVVQSNGVYSITNEDDVKAVRDKVKNSGKRGIVLVFCPDRYNSYMTANKYGQLWSDLVGQVDSDNISRIDVIKPVRKGLLDDGLVDGKVLEDKGIDFQVKEPE